jgi:hypothetical protein
VGFGKYVSVLILGVAPLRYSQKKERKKEGGRGGWKSKREREREREREKM